MKINENPEAAEAERRWMLKIKFYNLVFVTVVVAAGTSWGYDKDGSLRHFLFPFVPVVLVMVPLMYAWYRYKARP